MSSQRVVWVVVVLLFACAWWRPRRVSGAASPAVAAALPVEIEGERAVDLALDASERLLARRANVAISKKRYGTSLVTAVVVVGGVREHHPAEVCLRASGLEITSRSSRHLTRGCVSLLRVRRGGSEAAVAASYLDENGQGSCSLAQRIAKAAWGQLVSVPQRWIHLQILDRDPARAMRRLQELRNKLRWRRER